MKDIIKGFSITLDEDGGGEVQLPWYAVYVFRNEKGTGAEMCPTSIPGIVTEDAQAQVSYWPMFFRKSSNKNDRDQVL